MIIALASFESQFDSALVAKGKKIFDSEQVSLLTNKKLLWNAEVLNAISDTKTKLFKVSLYVEKSNITAVFCSCGPAICPHVIAVMYALQKKLKIKPADYVQSLPAAETRNLPEENSKAKEAPAISPAVLLSRKLNRTFYGWRKVKIDLRELEDLGVGFLLDDAGEGKIRKIIRDDVTPYGKAYILTGAKKILGAALLRYEKKKYASVFKAAKVVLEEVIDFEIRGYSDENCGEAAAALMEELYNSPSVPDNIKNEIFYWVFEALQDKEYWKMHDYLMPVVSLRIHAKEQQEKILELLVTGKNLHCNPLTLIPAKSRLLNLLGREAEAQQVISEKLIIYPKEFVGEVFSRQNYTEAKRLVNEIKQRTEGKDAETWNDWLFKIAVAENDLPVIREYHKNNYFLKGFKDESYFDCRVTYTTAEWSQELPTWIKHFEQKQVLDGGEAMALGKIYMRENVAADKVIEHFKKYPEYELAKLCSPVIKQHQEEELLKCYYNYFTARAAKNQSLQSVGPLRKEIKACMTSPLSIKILKQLAQDLIDQYPSKKGFQKELSLLLK